MIDWTKPITRIIAIIALCGLLAAIFALSECRRAQTAGTVAKLATGQADASMKSGVDAVGTFGNTQSNETAIDQTGRENANAIDHATGANATIDPAVRAAGLRALCRRPSYRAAHPACVQQPAP